MGAIMGLNWRFVNAAGDNEVGWRSPVTTPANPLWPYQQMALQIPEFQAAGFTVIALPPSTEGAAGVFSGGYDKKDDYSLENTAFGTAEMLRQLIACAHAYGIEIYGDLVLHQYDGGPGGSYPTKRFPKTPQCFAAETTSGGVEADFVPDNSGNFPFGDLAAYQHAVPAGYMHNGAIAASQWLAATTGVDGFRIDDAKGTNPTVIWDILHSPGIADLYAFFEYYDANPGAVSNYVNGYMQRRGPALDFQFKFNVQNICNNNSRVWMGQLANIGYCNDDPAMAMPFIESADTDTSAGEQLIWNKALAIAILFAFPGYQEVYYRDWSTDPNCYALKPIFLNMLWIARYLLQGDFVMRMDWHPQVFAAERLGYGDAPGGVFICNNDQYNDYTVTIQTTLGAYQRAHGYTPWGEYDDTWTDADGRLTVTVPKNDNGLSYLVYGKPIDPPAEIAIVPLRTRQTLYGAVDLVNTEPLPEAGTITIGRVWAGAMTELTATLRPDQAGWGNSIEIRLDIYDPSGTLLTDLAYDDQGDAAQGVTAALKEGGWYTFAAETSGLPTEGSAFALELTYTGAAVEFLA